MWAIKIMMLFHTYIIFTTSDTSHRYNHPNTIPKPKPNKNPDISITISEDMCKSLSLIDAYFRFAVLLLYQSYLFLKPLHQICRINQR